MTAGVLFALAELEAFVAHMDAHPRAGGRPAVVEAGMVACRRALVDARSLPLRPRVVRVAFGRDVLEAVAREALALDGVVRFVGPGYTACGAVLRAAGVSR